MINTRGFGVDVLPTYSPVNPSLVAFNPTNITNGMLSAFQVADAYKKLQAFDAAQKELAATRDTRIESQNTGNLAKTALGNQTIQVVPGETKSILNDQAFNELIRQPKETYALNDLTGKLERQGLDQAEAMRAAQELATTAEARTASNIAATNAAKVKSETASTNAETEAAVISNELHDKLLNATSDADRKRALQEAELAFTKAKIKDVEADAQFKLGYGRQTGAHRDTTNADINAVKRSIDQINNTKLPDGRTLLVYEGETYNPDGSLKTGFFGGVPQLDKSAERMLALRREREKDYANLIEGDARDVKNSMIAPSGITPITVPGIQPISSFQPTPSLPQIQPVSTPTPNKNVAEALDWIKAHPTDPRVPQILQKLGLTK